MSTTINEDMSYAIKLAQDYKSLLEQDLKSTYLHLHNLSRCRFTKNKENGSKLYDSFVDKTIMKAHSSFLESISGPDIEIPQSSGVTRTPILVGGVCLKIIKNIEGMIANSLELSDETLHNDLSCFIRTFNYDRDLIYLVQEISMDITEKWTNDNFGVRADELPLLLLNGKLNMSDSMDIVRRHMCDILEYYNRLVVKRDDICNIENWGLVKRDEILVPVILDRGF